MNLCDHVKEVGQYLYEELDKVMADYDFIKCHRGVGLMQGLVFDGPVAEYINVALSKGLVLINAGADIIRFLPPLVIEKSDVDKMIKILRESIEEVRK